MTAGQDSSHSWKKVENFDPVYRGQEPPSTSLSMLSVEKVKIVTMLREHSALVEKAMLCHYHSKAFSDLIVTGHSSTEEGGC